MESLVLYIIYNIAYSIYVLIVLMAIDLGPFE